MIDHKDMGKTLINGAIVAVLAAGGGWLLGSSETAEQARRIQNLEESMLTLKTKLGGRFVFMNDAASRVEFICGRDAECRRRFEPMRIPE